MDEFLRNFIPRKWNVRGVTFTFLDLLLAVCITGTGLALRSTVIEYTPTDTWKLCAVVLEFALAVLCGAIVHSYTESRLRAFLTYAILAIYPTAVANGSLWNINCIYYVILFFLGLYLYSRGNALFGTGSILAGLLIAPYMPAWAGYTADVAALIYFMRWPKRFYLPMLHLIVSYSAYAYAINGETKLPMVVFSVLLLAMLTNVGVDLYRAAVKGE